VSVANPYADLRALLDATRQLTPEEMAELQLEQGYVDRALRIYDELTRREPSNASYATRRAWLARMAAVRPARTIAAGVAQARPDEVADPPAEPREHRETLHGLGPAGDREPTARVVRELPIVRVR
jgi:hypothetical protein